MSTNTKQPSCPFSSCPFTYSYADALPTAYASVAPEKSPKPELLYFNKVLAKGLNWDLNHYSEPELATLFSGNTLPEGCRPIAQAYAGHQFGNFNPQLGDGRALIIGELFNAEGLRYDIALKGSGRTPFSRSGDGKAAVGPMLRELIISEAMHALNIPTTRSLAVIATGETVYRNGPEPGAILTRVAASHIRIGTFAFFAAQSDKDTLKLLADYTIARHDPSLAETDTPYLGLLQAVLERQAKLIAKWMGIGFIHGVMNTDNMTICGETIDYGPCAFIESYNPAAVFSSIDQHGRYAYQNQPPIALWNLTRFAEALLPLLGEDIESAKEQLMNVLSTFQVQYEQQWLSVMRDKLGLKTSDDADKTLVENWLNLLSTQKVDFTLAWRYLADVAAGEETRLQELFTDETPLNNWLNQWQARCQQDDRESPHDNRAQAMRQVNPWLIPRNHHVEEALLAASRESNLEPSLNLLAALSNPFMESEEYSHLSTPASAMFTEYYQTFCGT